MLFSGIMQVLQCVPEWKCHFTHLTLEGDTSTRLHTLSIAVDYVCICSCSHKLKLDGCIVWNAHNTVLGEEALLIYIIPVCYVKTGRYGKT